MGGQPQQRQTPLRLIRIAASDTCLHSVKNLQCWVINSSICKCGLEKGKPISVMVFVTHFVPELFAFPCSRAASVTYWNLMFATWPPPAPRSLHHQCQASNIQAYSRRLWQTLQHRLCADRVAGKQAGRQAPTSFFYCLPLVTPSLKIAVLFTRNCYQRRGQKNDHMPRAADLCFLYLRVSQNTALYRDTEKRPRQASSRTGGFVFSRAHEGRTHSVFSCKNAAWRAALSRAHRRLTMQHFSPL